MPAHVTYFNSVAKRHSWCVIPDNIRAFYKMKLIFVALVVGINMMILPVREITKGKMLSQAQQLKSAAWNFLLTLVDQQAN